MTAEGDLLVSTATDIFGAHCDAEALARSEDGWNEELWAQLAELGFPLLGIPEDDGGAGGTLADVAAVAKVAGRFAAPVPLADGTLVAAWALKRAGLEIPEERPAVAAPSSSLKIERTGRGWRLRGRLARVPFGRFGGSAVAVAHRSRAGRRGARAGGLESS
ncbi:MAG: acyl-CoA dehydrogenase family protein [Thermoleophilaceae bacterium]